MNNAAVRSVCAVVVVLVLANVAVWPSLQSLWSYWMAIQDYQHGPLIALLAVVWMARIAWREGIAGARFSLAGTAALGALLLAWLVTWRAGIDIAQQLLWPLIVGAGLCAVLGVKVARRFALALIFLYFAVPVWEYALPVLQRCSIFFSEKMLAALGVQATVTENLVTIPEGTFAIVEGCSGKRYLVVTLAMAWLAAAVNGIAGWRLMLFLAISAALSMVINWVRIVIIIYAGHVSNMQHYLVANEHLTLGNVMFLPLLAAVLLLARRFAKPVLPGAQVPAPEVASDRASHLSASVLLPTGMMLATFAFVLWGQPSAQQAALGGPPLATGRWQGPLPARSGWMPQYTAADAQVRAAYINDSGDLLELYANVYSSQTKDREMIHYGNSLVHPAGWTRAWSAAAQPLVAGNATLTSVQVQDPAGQRWLLAHIYRVGTGTYRTDVFAKLAYGWRSLGGQTPAGVIAIAARCVPGNCDKAGELVADFWENMQPDLLAVVPAGVNTPP